MVRTARIVLENAFYHVIARGNQKQKIFIDNADYKKYLRLLKRYKKEFSVAIYAYCLMPNHIHLILKPFKLDHFSRFMKVFHQTYTQYFNNKYQKAGHLWQGRFKSFLINDEQYFLDCIKYIEFNPIRAQIATSLNDYLWSSYHVRILGKKNGMLNSIEEALKGDTPQQS